MDYSFEQGAMIYGSVSQGFKSGGFNFTSADPGYDPETLWSYELGAKMDWLGKQLRTNVVLFYYDYTDLQVSDFTQPGVLSISNAADASVQGVEIENQWVPGTNWLLEFNYAYLDATYDKYLAPAGAVMVDVAGNDLNAAPRHKLNLASQYFQEISQGTLSYRVEFAWQDKQYFTAFNQDVSSQGAYGLWNARIAFHSLDEKWEVQAYGENLADEAYSTSSREFPAVTVGVTKDINPPRTFGLKLVYLII
jgi:iron complex outermembrane receptor protein